MDVVDSSSEEMLVRLEPRAAGAVPESSTAPLRPPLLRSSGRLRALPGDPRLGRTLSGAACDRTPGGPSAVVCSGVPSSVKMSVTSMTDEVVLWALPGGALLNEAGVDDTVELAALSPAASAAVSGAVLFRGEVPLISPALVLVVAARGGSEDPSDSDIAVEYVEKEDEVDVAAVAWLVESDVSDSVVSIRSGVTSLSASLLEVVKEDDR